MTSFLKLASLLIFGSALAVAQTPPPYSIPVKNLYAAGVSYNVNAKPSISGTTMYGHLITAPGTYGFVVMDVLPNTTKPFTVTSNIGAGVAQKMFSIGRASLIMPTTAGVSWTGSNTGWQWTGGLAVPIYLKSNLFLVPTFRYIKSSVSNGTGYQPIIGLAIGFGK
jgi:hypothetical protein